MSFSIKTLIVIGISYNLLSLGNTLPCPIGETVQSPDECLPYNKPGHYCCFLSEPFSKTSICLQISKSLYNGVKNYSLGGVLYDIECREQDEFRNPTFVVPGSPCGVIEPSSAEECHIYSTPQSSCCLYKLKSSAGCYNLGLNSRGKVNLLGMTLDC
jgi:hypothetical protein